MVETPSAIAERAKENQTDLPVSEEENPARPKSPQAPVLNAEKLRALEAEGNVLVIANPGTGKTLLLAHKYVQLISRGVRPEEILCLTYTNKATDEMRQAILTLRKEGRESAHAVGAAPRSLLNLGWGGG